MSNKNRMDSDTVLTTTGKAYDASYQSLRPIFSGVISYQKTNDKIIAQRVWNGIDSEVVAKETLIWSEQDGLLSANMCQRYLREEGALERNGNEIRFMLSSHKTQYSQKVSSMHVNKLIVTLLSMPLEIIRNWNHLMDGKQFDRSYAVIKVRNHTGVRFRMRNDNHQSVVSVTPLNPMWRCIFGSINFVFEKNRPLLKEICGLIEPRDHKMNGKYKEYVASFKLDSPLDIGHIITPITTDAKVN